MKKTFFLLPVLVTLCFMTPPAFAEVRSGAITVSPFVGGYTFDSTEHLKTNIAAGMRLGYNLNKSLSVESQFIYVPLESKFSNQKGDLIGIRGDVLYHFMPENRLVPFVALGGGWSKKNKSYSNEDGTLDYGIGVKYFLKDWLALRGDVRKIDSFHTPGYWQNFEYTVGLSFQLGGTKAAAAITAKAPEIKAPAQPSEKTKPAPTPVPPPAVEQAPAAEPVQVEEGQTVLLATKSTDVVLDGKIEITALELQPNALEIVASERFPYQIYTLSNPSRLAIDIPNAVNGLGVDSIPVNKLGIATVRIGSHADFLRIVLDATEGNFLPYRIEETGKGLKIIMKAAELKK